MINFQNETQNLHILKNSYLFHNDQHKTCVLLGQINVFWITLQKISFKKKSYEKVKKDLKIFTIFL
jgi:hypothetical protein